MGTTRLTRTDTQQCCEMSSAKSSDEVNCCERLMVPTDAGWKSNCPPHHHHAGDDPNAPPAKWHSFKMLVDPQIHRGAPKMVRYDGSIVPGNPHHIPPTPSDPRKKLPTALWRRLEAMELSVPKFRVDENYVGEPPKVEVTIENLNDNVDKHFLHQMVSKYGQYEEMTIFYHPVTKKHLGLARLVFEEVRSARECVRVLHGKSVMGKELNCYLDPYAKSCKKMLEDLTTEKKPEPLPPPREPTPPPPTLAAATSADDSKSGEDAKKRPKASESRASDSKRDPRGVEAPSRRHEHRSSRDSRDRRGRRKSELEDDRSKDWNNSWSNHESSESGPPHEKASEAESSQYDPSAYDPQYSRPEYWLQEAQRYAAQAAAAARRTSTADSTDSGPAPANLPPNHEEVDGDEAPQGDDDHKVDLDTRLKMLMKDKTGAMPAFLLQDLNASDEEEASELPKHEEPTAEAYPVFLSRAPSPFLSEDVYRKCYHDCVEERNASFKREEDDVGDTLQGFQTNRQTRARPSSRNSDQMSLSSLSSGENNILEQPPPYGYYPIPNPDAVGMYSDYSQQYASSMMPSQYHQYGAYYPSSDQAWYNQAYLDGRDSKSVKDSFRPVVNGTTDRFVKELKQQLTKDINKKLCETFAFFLYDKWWQEQEEKYKAKNTSSQPSKVPSASTAPTTAAKIPELLSSEDKSNSVSQEVTAKAVAPSTSVKVEDLTAQMSIAVLFDKQRESLESGSTMKAAWGGSLGFGFRGTIPKLPSFKRKTASSARDGRKGRGRDSSDEDKKRSSDKTKVSEKRKEQEKRRDERRKGEKGAHDAHDKEKKKDKDKTHKDEEKSGGKITDPSLAKKKTQTQTLQSTYSAIYSDSSRGARSSGDEDSDAKKGKKTSPTSRRKASSASASPSASPSSSEIESSSEDEYSSPASRSSSGSSSDSNSDSGESRRGKSKAKKTKPKSKAEVVEDGEDMDVDITNVSSPSVKVKSRSVSGSGSGSSGSSSSGSSSSGSGSSSSSESEGESESRKPASDTENRKQPVPVRRPSVKTTSHNGDVGAAAEESHISDHCYAKPSSEEQRSEDSENAFASQFANDHGYTRPRTPPRPSAAAKPVVAAPKPAAPPQPVKTVPAPPPRPAPVFKARDYKEQYRLIYRFLEKGLDLEDLSYLKRSYEKMLLESQQQSDQAQNDKTYYLNDTHWVDHSITDVPDPPRKRRRDDFSRPHRTGSCRTEGYYKMDPREKARTKYHLHRPDADIFSQTRIANVEGAVTKGKLQTAQNLSREARSNVRRQLAVLGDEVLNSDLLKFNQLKFRRKQMTFGKSAIHDWGLFALEDIGPDEMVIEYVGQVVRAGVSDAREKRYEKQGIGSSYLFRIDLEYVVDATKCGNLARFINHSCDPNCYAKVITVDGEKKIVIYSKQPIAFGEEITYDYKFPIEEEKIICLCGSKNCRKYLN